MTELDLLQSCYDELCALRECVYYGFCSCVLLLAYISGTR